MVRSLDRNGVLQPQNEGARVAALGEVEIQTVGLRFDLSSLAMHARLDDLLLQEEERTLVVHLDMIRSNHACLLAELHDSLARVLDRFHNAVFARLRLDDESHNEGLLEHHVEHLLLHGDVELDAARVRLRPNELGIHQLHVLQP